MAATAGCVLRVRGIPPHVGAGLAAGFGLLLALNALPVHAQAPPSYPGVYLLPPSPAQGAAVSLDELAHRLQNLERQNAELVNQNRALLRQLDTASGRYEQLNRRLEQVEQAGAPGRITPPAAAGTPDATPELPQPRRTESGEGEAATQEAKSDAGKKSEASAGGKDDKEERNFVVGDYDAERGEFVLVRPVDANKHPFELRADLWTQVRYTHFGRDRERWVDSTGTPQPIRNFDSIEVTRNFVRLSGFGIDPRLQYSAFLFSSTALNDTVYLGWVNFRFSDAFDLRVGNWQVPGTREWVESFRYTLGADRLMATTFFRPNISPGVWAQGEPVENLHYVAMVANSFNRFNRGVDTVGSSVAFGGTLRWEPLGEFGPGYSDIEDHASPVVRVGNSLALSRESNQGFGTAGLSNPEDTILRLSDGTPLFRPDALGPGVQLSRTDVQLWTVDAAMKYRGLSLSGEYFFRWLDTFQSAAAPPAFDTLFDHGGLLQGGCFVIPARLEPFARTSFVTGRFGSGSEYGGGVNWYPRATRDWRFTFEVLRVSQSPAQNILTGYRAGEDGLLYQLQCFIDF